MPPHECWEGVALKRLPFGLGFSMAEGSAELSSLIFAILDRKYGIRHKKFREYARFGTAFQIVARFIVTDIIIIDDIATNDAQKTNAREGMAFQGGGA